MSRNFFLPIDYEKKLSALIHGMSVQRYEKYCKTTKEVQQFEDYLQEYEIAKPILDVLGLLESNELEYLFSDSGISTIARMVDIRIEELFLHKKYRYMRDAEKAFMTYLKEPNDCNLHELEKFSQKYVVRIFKHRRLMRANFHKFYTKEYSSVLNELEFTWNTTVFYLLSNKSLQEKLQ